MSTENRERPVGLWVIAIIAILLGSFGGCAGAFGLLTLATQDQLADLQQSFTQTGQNTEELRQINEQMQADVAEITHAFQVPLLLANLANVMASSALLIAAILLLRWHPMALGFCTGAIALSIAADLFLGAVSAAVQQQTLVVMEDFGQRLGEASGGATAQHLMGGVMKASGAVGLCVGVSWLCAKLGFYVSAIIHVRRQKVRALFA